MIGAIKDIWYAITSPESYQEFMNYKKRRLFLHVFILVLISGIVTMVIPAVQFMAEGGFEAILEENIPDFTASAENGFWIEEPFEIDEYNFLIKADSDVVREDITDLDGQYGSYEYVIMVDKEQIYLKNAGMQEITARFDEMPGFSVSKADLLGLVPLMCMTVIWVAILMFFIDFGYYFLTAFVISWGARVIAVFMGLRLGSAKLYKMSVYAGTLPYILTLVQIITEKNIPNFSFFSLIISMGYLYFAMKEYKENGIEELPPEQFENREG